jgi:hypothetical protein
VGLEDVAKYIKKLHGLADRMRRRLDDLGKANAAPNDDLEIPACLDRRPQRAGGASA